MRGVKYNLKFTELDKTIRIYNDLLIDDCIQKLKEIIKEIYNVDMKISKHIIYNLVHRPNKSNKFIREIAQLEISNKKKDTSIAVPTSTSKEEPIQV